MSYYGENLKGANLPFNFQLLQCPWSAAAVAEVISEYDRKHCRRGHGRTGPSATTISRALPSRVRQEHQARVAAMLIFTLPGTLTMYYGEEIGMTNVPIAPEQVQDPAEKNEPGIGQGRDPERTPMCWDQSPLAGFTTGEPWLPLGEDHSKVNVAVEQQDGESILQLYGKLIALRKAHPTLIGGKLLEIHVEQNVLRFQRSGADEIEVILNMSHEEIAVPIRRAIVLAGTCGDREGQTVTGLSTLWAAEGLLLLTA